MVLRGSKSASSQVWNGQAQIELEHYETIIGVDEAGRGPLAGPVVAAAVVLPRGCCIEGLDDSKKISAAKRERLFARVTQTALAWAVGFGTVQEIDSLGILQANFLAMRRALSQVRGIHPGIADLVLVDGNLRIAGLNDVNQQPIVKGDSKVASIAAASILAKVKRDAYMTRLGSQFPAYGFEVHMGYGVPAHLQALRQYGPSPHHRTSFKVKLL